MYNDTKKTAKKLDFTGIFCIFAFKNESIHKLSCKKTYELSITIYILLNIKKVKFSQKKPISLDDLQMNVLSLTRKADA